jgi:hypothetical protein
VSLALVTGQRKLIDEDLVTGRAGENAAALANPKDPHQAVPRDGVGYKLDFGDPGHGTGQGDAWKKNAPATGKQRKCAGKHRP